MVTDQQIVTPMVATRWILHDYQYDEARSTVSAMDERVGTKIRTPEFVERTWMGLKSALGLKEFLADDDYKISCFR